jgi:hypothetical protein
LSNAYGMTSGEISKVTRALGVPVGQPDVSNILGKGASKFVMGDRSRESGKAVRYRLSRRGVQHVEGVLAG